MPTTPTTDNWPEIQTASQAALPKQVVRFIDKVRQGPHPESQLIHVLHKLQDALGYLGPQQLDAVAQLMQIPAAKVAGVANFYHFFRLRPKGRFVISVCLGTACYVKGAQQVLDRLKQELSVDIGQTSPDGVFSLEAARCLGTCGLAPVIMIENSVHGPLKPDMIPALLDQYRHKAAESPAPAEVE